ncbi:Hypothetical_protein [Hexamita inflata]|uniref:Hypothetical_protein n=1 Tax=Hexamita inflata TaxID=28002 RepID=A0ABP1HBC4_9EUKA
MFACIVLQSIQLFCNMPDYPQELIEEDSALLLSMNNKGLQQYVQCAIQQSRYQLLQISYPGLTFNISIDGILYKVDFKNISLIEMDANDNCLFHFKHFEVTGKLEASHADNSVRKFDQAEIFALLNIARAIDSKLDESQLKNTKPFVEFPCLQQRYLVSWPNSVQASMLLRQSQNLPKSINWKV